MNQIIFSGLFLVYALSFTTSTTTYNAPEIPLEIPLEAPEIAQMTASTPEWVKMRISHYADYYGVSEITLNNIVKCESGFNPNAINSSPQEYSVGLVQINLRTHLKNGITKEMALDPEFSLDFLARKIKEGKGHLWTCYRTN